MIKFAKPLIAAKFGAVGFLVSGVVAQPYRLVVIRGASMCPTYSDRSVHFETTVSGPLYRGEVVVLKSPVGTIIKRIAYLGGETIPQFKIDDSWVDLTSVTVSRRISDHTKIRMHRLDPGQIYVLGDNRAVSVDSRSFGPLPAKDVMGILVDQKPLHLDRFVAPGGATLAVFPTSEGS